MLVTGLIDVLTSSHFFRSPLKAVADGDCGNSERDPSEGSLLYGVRVRQAGISWTPCRREWAVDIVLGRRRQGSQWYSSKENNRSRNVLDG